MTNPHARELAGAIPDLPISLAILLLGAQMLINAFWQSSDPKTVVKAPTPPPLQAERQQAPGPGAQPVQPAG